MRRPVAVVGVPAGLAVFGLLLLGVTPMWAQSDCSVAFERWTRLSSVRVVPQGSAARGACVASDAVRSDLLEGLARVRGVCAEAPDQGAQQTGDLLNANLSFIASLTVCPPPAGASAASNADTGEGWAAKSAPIIERPKVAAPPPVAPPPVAPPPAVAIGGPRPLAPAVSPSAPPRAVGAAPVPAAVVPGAPSTGPAPTPPCLEVARSQSDTFAFVNHRCRGYTVLAVIETQGASGETSCKGYSITQSLALRSASAVPPRVNYECVLSQGPCNKERLGDMFPECDW